MIGSNQVLNVMEAEKYEGKKCAEKKQEGNLDRTHILKFIP
jgi:hypothetical protein